MQFLNTHRRTIAIVYFVVLALLNFGDSMGNVVTLTDDSMMQTAMELLGISREGELARLAIIIPLPFLIGVAALATAFGIYRITPWAMRAAMVTVGLLVAYALVQVITVFTLPQGAGFALFFVVYLGAFAAISFVVARWASAVKKNA